MAKLVLAIVIAVALVGVFGCDGGDSDSVPTLKGVANIHAESVKPRVGALALNSQSEFYSVTSTGTKKSSSGWQDVNFTLPLPIGRSREVYALAAYNDLDGNQAYETGELLGFCSHFLVGPDSDGKFQIVSSGNQVIKADATKCSGRDVYIDCLFTKKTSVQDIVESYKKIQSAL
ncbi:MAG: hypothetical protein WC107_01040 [Patescibacteria group bacterium]